MSDDPVCLLDDEGERFYELDELDRVEEQAAGGTGDPGAAATSGEIGTGWREEEDVGLPEDEEVRGELLSRLEAGDQVVEVGDALGVLAVETAPDLDALGLDLDEPGDLDCAGIGGSEREGVEAARADRASTEREARRDM